VAKISSLWFLLFLINLASLTSLSKTKADRLRFIAWAAFISLKNKRNQNMFTIEHEFDATVVTLIDEGRGHRQPDVTVNAFEECITLVQHEPSTDTMQTVTLSMKQIQDLAASLNLPEGSYRSGNA
jgi:hypothetical protein